MNTDNYTLTIKDVNIEDSGEYKIIAENEHGKQEKVVKIVVEEEKEPKQEKKDQPKVVNDLKVKQANNNSVSIEWQKPDDTENLELIVVQCKEKAKKEWKEVAKISSNETGYAVEKVKNKLFKHLQAFKTIVYLN